MPTPFLDPGGQEESPGTPHWSLASKGRIPQGGGVVVIYNKMRSVFIKQGRWLYLCLESGDSVERMNFNQAPFCINIAYTKKDPLLGKSVVHKREDAVLLEGVNTTVLCAEKPSFFSILSWFGILLHQYLKYH